MSACYEIWKKFYKNNYTDEPYQSWFATYDNFVEWCIDNVEDFEYRSFYIIKWRKNMPWTKFNARVVYRGRNGKDKFEKGLITNLKLHRSIKLSESDWQKKRDDINELCELNGLQFRIIKDGNDIIIER